LDTRTYHATADADLDDGAIPQTTVFRGKKSIWGFASWGSGMTPQYRRSPAVFYNITAKPVEVRASLVDFPHLVGYLAFHFTMLSGLENIRIDRVDLDRALIRLESTRNGRLVVTVNNDDGDDRQLYAILCDSRAPPAQSDLAGTQALVTHEEGEEEEPTSRYDGTGGMELSVDVGGDQGADVGEGEQGSVGHDATRDGTVGDDSARDDAAGEDGGDSSPLSSTISIDWIGADSGPTRISLKGRRTLALSGSSAEHERADKDSSRGEELDKDSSREEELDKDGSQAEELDEDRNQKGQPDEDSEGGEQMSVDGDGEEQMSVDGDGKEQMSVDGDGEEQMPLDSNGEEQMSVDSHGNGQPPQDRGGDTQPPPVVNHAGHPARHDRRVNRAVASNQDEPVEEEVEVFEDMAIEPAMNPHQAPTTIKESKAIVT